MAQTSLSLLNKGTANAEEKGLSGVGHYGTTTDVSFFSMTSLSAPKVTHIKRLVNSTSPDEENDPPLNN